MTNHLLVGQELLVVESIISEFKAAGAAWDATMVDGNLETEGPEYERYEDAEWALVEYQCETFAEAQRKIEYLASNREFSESLQRTTDYFDTFMRSLLVGSPVDNSGGSSNG